MKDTSTAAEILLLEIKTRTETRVDDPEDLPLEILTLIEGYFIAREMVDKLIAQGTRIEENPSSSDSSARPEGGRV